jgi:hypothetical protein
MEEIKLEELFSDAYKLFETFDKRDDPTNSPEFQVSTSWPVPAHKSARFRKLSKLHCFVLIFYARD